jgi:uncharacterized protein YhaN
MNTGWTVDTLYQHFDERFDALERSLDRRFGQVEATMERDGASRDQAVHEARVVIEQRLGALNELRAEVTEDRGQLVQRTTFDARLDALDAKIATRNQGVDERFATIEQWRNRAIGVVTVLMIGSSTLGVFVGWVLAR